MKSVIAILFGCFVFSSYSQIVEKTLDKRLLGPFRCEKTLKINVESNDTTVKCYCAYQNKKYQHIVDMGIIGLYRESDRDKLVKDIKMCLPYMENNSDAFSVGRFKIYDFSKNLYYTSSSEEYTYINKKQCLKWLEWLENLTF
tara:strand:- start:53 stop:481 length:429 start_codon:yes stop_codon:yes gene_type:complete